MNAKVKDKKVIPGNEDDANPEGVTNPEELAKLKSDAEGEAEKIKTEAEEAAVKIKSEAVEEAAKIKSEAIEAAAKIKTEAEEVAFKIKSDAETEVSAKSEEKVEVKKKPTLSEMRASSNKQVENAQKRAEEEKGKD
jgi:vacuolar-type H+-ATPase subunit E/Vma4